ncbi:ATP-binding protein, partial [Streptomyces californicus]
ASPARHAAPGPPTAVAPSEPWTPEAARASIAGVISGTLRGRAAVDADAEPSPPGGQPLPTTPHEHDGGRP